MEFTRSISNSAAEVKAVIAHSGSCIEIYCGNSWVRCHGIYQGKAYHKEFLQYKPQARIAESCVTIRSVDANDCEMYELTWDLAQYSYSFDDSKLLLSQGPCFPGKEQQPREFCSCMYQGRRPVGRVDRIDTNKDGPN